jgi:hypothetical protein
MVLEQAEQYITNAGPSGPPPSGQASSPELQIVDCSIYSEREAGDKCQSEPGADKGNVLIDNACREVEHGKNAHEVHTDREKNPTSLQISGRTVDHVAGLGIHLAGLV